MTNKEKVIAAIKTRPMATIELAALGIPRFAVTSAIRELYEAGDCHIAEYPRIGHQGRRMPRYAYGYRADAETPGELSGRVIPLTAQESHTMQMFLQLAHALAGRQFTGVDSRR